MRSDTGGLSPISLSIWDEARPPELGGCWGGQNNNNSRTSSQATAGQPANQPCLLPKIFIGGLMTTLALIIRPWLTVQLGKSYQCLHYYLVWRNIFEYLTCRASFTTQQDLRLAPHHTTLPCNQMLGMSIVVIKSSNPVLTFNQSSLYSGGLNKLSTYLWGNYAQLSCNITAEVLRYETGTWQHRVVTHFTHSYHSWFHLLQITVWLTF